MDEFVHRIVKCLTTEAMRLSVVKNPDGFLCAADTQQKVLDESGLLLLPIASGIELRVRYELEDKHSENHVCYIVDNTDEILPDIKSHLYIAPTFTIAKLMPACNETELLHAKLTFGMASYIFNTKLTRNLTKEETRYLLLESEELYGIDPQEIISTLKAIPLQWEKNETMESICTILMRAIEKGAYKEIESIIEELNDDFQIFINSKYFSFINSSSIKKPKMVHKILPHLTHVHQRTDKVALLVVDGMTYWQYLILDKALNEEGIKTQKDITFAWLPSITKLSRQAIFRGEAPRMDYRQSPTDESRLWVDYWTSSQRQVSKRMQDYEVEYTHGGLSVGNDNLSRLAFVDVSLDEKMHSLDNNKDLFVLTKNWTEEFANDIKALHEQGYQIYITTDHGNVLANPWRLLNSQERTYLYEKESRGKRHLIYNNIEHLHDFLQSNQEINSQLFVHDNWAVWRNTKSFNNKDSITHGGAHFLEVVIPFVKIEKK